MKLTAWGVAMRNTRSTRFKTQNMVTLERDPARIHSAVMGSNSGLHYRRVIDQAGKNPYLYERIRNSVCLGYNEGEVVRSVRLLTKRETGVTTRLTTNGCTSQWRHDRED